jgi:hypothetical protein
MNTICSHPQNIAIPAEKKGGEYEAICPLITLAEGRLDLIAGVLKAGLRRLAQHYDG